jgi:signal transduction histidine kinase
MTSANNKFKIVLITALVALVTFLHYSTRMQQVYFHIFYRELYFLPLILAGFWFGLRGGLTTSLGIAVLYLPLIVKDWENFSPFDFDRLLAILLFNVIAAGLGFIADRRKAEETARIQAERMAREQAESASRLKSDFLSLVSHELRTPLISIIGYNDLLLDGVAGSLNEEQIESLKKLDKSSKRLLELINAMLDISSIEARSAEFKETSMTDLIEEVKSESRSLFEHSELYFEWKVEPELRLQTDSAKLKVILKNLISNAVKFTEKGSVTVEVRRHDDGIEISVIDSGIGIPAEALKLIFEPFRQIESPLIRSRGGAGLGLYIVKRLVEILHGRMEVESEPGHGSTFRVRIPAKNISEEDTIAKEVL